MIAVGLQYLGDAPADRLARLDSATADQNQELRSEIVRREQLVAALEELEARRQEVRQLRQRLGLPAHGEATAPALSRVPSRMARWAQTAWMRSLVTYGVPGVYLLAIVLGEALIAAGVAPLGLLLGLGLLAVLPLHANFAGRRQAALLTALTLLPLIRVLTLALPLGSFSLLGAYVLVGVPVLLGAGATVWVLGLSARGIGLRGGNPLVQAGIASIGVPLGLVQFAALGPSPLAGQDAGPFILSALVLVVCVALAEEIVYRGILQPAASLALGRAGMLYTSLAFAAGYLGNGTVASVALAFAVGLLFAFLRVKTRSLIGVMLAHSVALVLWALILPRVMTVVR